ncbi:MAG: hypothetical protein ACRDBG_03675 [Waterburya sp.]
MTDYEKYYRLFSETGVPFVEVDGGLRIEVSPNPSKGNVVTGYYQSHNTLLFDEITGQLVEFGIWE